MPTDYDDDDFDEETCQHCGQVIGHDWWTITHGHSCGVSKEPEQPMDEYND